jgi:mannonate dehydratase
MTERAGAPWRPGETDRTDVMRIAIGQFNEASHERLTFAKQLGVSGVLLNTPRLPGEHRWEYEDLVRLREHIEGYGLRLEALENTPKTFYEQAMLGGPEAEREIEHYQATIRNVGRAGIPILGYHWMPNSVWRTPGPKTIGRGGARVTAFEMTRAQEMPRSHDREYSADDLWASYERFIKAVIPVAEEAGVKLALHPDDPPVPTLGGVGRIFNSFEGFKRGSEIVDSPNWGLDFCMGCWSEMGGNENVLRGIKYFAPQGKILYGHFRDVQGTAGDFSECFLGEGNVNLFQAMRTFKESGFTGFLIDDHVPHMVDDSEWGHRGRAYATGYMIALLNAVGQIA